MPLVRLGEFSTEFGPDFDPGHVTMPGDPVTVDLQFLAEPKAFSTQFSTQFRNITQVDPMFFAGSFGEEFDGDFQRETPTPYGTTMPARPKHRFWSRFAYQAIPNGLLLFRTAERIKLVTDFSDPEFIDADAAIMGGQEYICAYGCWQANLLEKYGFTLVPAVNLNAPPYILDDQGEMQ